MENFSLRTWITDGSGKPFYARKKIDLKDTPQNAVAYVCGLGQFNFYINGKKVSDHVLDPAWTDYNKIVYYVSFDITKYLQKGENEILAEVGNGWYLADFERGYSFHFPAFMPPNPNPYQAFNEELVLAIHADIYYPDGEKYCLDTDTSFETAQHLVVHSNCFGSEVMDGRIRKALRTASCWEPAKVAGSSAKLAALSKQQTMPAVKVIASLTGHYLNTVNGHAVYDFGQNVSGMLEFEARGQEGEEIHAYPAEKLTPEGDVDQVAKNWMKIDVAETLILGESNVFEPFAMTFTYFGGRYVAFDCAKEKLQNVRLLAISSAKERAGEFTCDDDRLMKIYDLTEKAVEANMVSVHTDCPTIERFAWQEENHLMAPSVMYMKKVKPHFEKFLTDTRFAQHTADDFYKDMDGGRFYPGDGLIPAQAPCYMPNVLPVPGLGDFYNVIGWGSTIILGTYWHYQFYGDKTILEENYEAGRKYLEFLKGNVTTDGFINNGLGDWGNPKKEYAKENIETVFLYTDAKLLSDFAAILGKTEDASYFYEYAQKVKKNYNEKLLLKNPETGRYAYKIWGEESFRMTQAAEAMPLYWGMVPEEREAEVAESLWRLLQEDGALITGEVGQPYIIQTMAKYGMNDLLMELILKKQHPSYYAFVLAGETTLGEYWEENPRSHCHDMMGHIIEWYYNSMAGIKPLTPGFHSVLIKPYLPLSVNRLACTYHSASGDITVSMQRIGRDVSLLVSAAEGIEVTIDRSNLDAR